MNLDPSSLNTSFSPSRTQKSLKNAQIGIICYLTSLFVSFFSRGIFLRHLGAEFLGFTGSIGSILNFLNIAELGIASTCGMLLYAPLFRRDYAEVSRIVSILGYLYRCVGWFILVAGVLVSFFLPALYPSVQFPVPILFLGYYAFLFAALLGYFVNYHAVLLSADQRNYVVTGYYQATYTIKVLLQLLIAVTSCNLGLYFLIEILGGIANALILRLKVRQTYPNLSVSVSQGKALLHAYPQLVSKVKQMIAHRLGDFVQNQSSPLFVYAFVSLPMVALYGNYKLLSGSLNTLLNQVLRSTNASVGNLVAEGNTQRSYSVYCELLSFRFFVAGIVSGCLYFLSTGFITLWLGAEYSLSSWFVFLLTLQFFLYLVRDVTDQYILAFGLIQDVWSPLVETFLFVLASLVFGHFWGLEGVMMGPIVSMLFLIYIWKPLFLFRQGFHLPLSRYLLPFCQYLLLALIPIVITAFLLDSCSSWYSDSQWSSWLLEAVICTSSLTMLSLGAFLATSTSFRHFINRLIHVHR